MAFFFSYTCSLPAALMCTRYHKNVRLEAAYRLVTAQAWKGSTGLKLKSMMPPFCLRDTESFEITGNTFSEPL